MTKTTPTMIAEVTCTTPLGTEQKFFTEREGAERKVMFLKECGCEVTRVRVVPREFAGTRSVVA